MKHFRTFIYLTIIICLLSSIYPNAAQAAQIRSDPIFYMIVKSSPSSAYATQTQFQSKSLYKELSQISKTHIAPLTLISDTIIHFHLNNEIKEYEVTADGILFDREKQAVIPLSKTATKQLREEVHKIRNQHYGKIISWENLKTEIPKYAKFSVTDLDTGLTYNVQRRAGSSHIDAQPLTKQDSATMKKIYSDKWSWNRRAVLIRYKNDTWAGSINGMPHGGDGIPDNDFKGHFCVHFEGSHTHKNHNLDYAHQVMNYKAAGMLEQFVENMSPEQIAELWLFAVNHQDDAVLRAITWLGNPVIDNPMEPNNEATSAAPVRSKKKQTRKKKQTSKKKQIAKSSKLNLTATVPVNATYTLPNHRRLRGTLQLRMVRTSPMDRWVIYQIDKETKNTNEKKQLRRP